MVILITGKAGAGKTHWAMEWINEQKSKTAMARPTVAWIDGDQFRAENNNRDFSEEGRFNNLQQAAKKAAKIEEQGMVVVCSFIAPTKELREMMRGHWRESVLIYIPGGTLWEGTTYETPEWDEFNFRKGDN